MAQKKTFNGKLGRSISKTEFSFKTADSPSKDKPNVIYIVIDDLGFSQLGCFGSDINTPNIDSLAAEGLRFNNFHTTAICSATRASLLTGANHHSAGISTIAENNSGLPNALGGINPQFATLAQILKEYDYRTMAIGKWHLVSAAERTDAGPYDNWPLGKGFETYYGFLDADMDQWHPVLTRDNTKVAQPKEPKEGYHLSQDLTDNAIKYIYNHEFTRPEQPFFLYLAYGAMHSPHHAPKEYVDKYKGKFDDGWDAIRQRWFENQKRLGVIPQNAELTERNRYVSAWDSLDDRHKKAYARYMEVFAGYLEHTDAQVGRLLDYLKEAEIIDDTIIVLISDNGASAEGGRDGHFNLNSSMDVREDYPEDVDLILENYESVGDEYSLPHYPSGWANAGNTPFQWYKQLTHEGGIKDPFIIRYPKLINDPGSVRGQYLHVSDITPTVMDILGFEKPDIIKGIPQKPFEGISFKDALSNADAPGKYVQHYEMHGNRSIYKDGWKAVVNHSFNASYGESFDDDEWELYHVEEDYSEKHNVADKYPEKLEELKEEWLIQAGRYNVFPMPDNGFLASRDSLKRYSGVVHRTFSLPEKKLTYKHVRYPYAIPSDEGLGSRTNTVIARLDRKDKKEEGVLIASGDRFGGISLYVKDNKPKYVYNVYGRTYYIAESDKELPLGKCEVKLAFTVTGDEKAKAELFVDGEKTGEAAIESFPYSKGPGGIASLKSNPYTSIYDVDYQAPYEYTGTIDEIDVIYEAVGVDADKAVKKAFLND